MSKRAEASQFYQLQTKVEKKSTVFILGYQPKILKMLEQGTKIAYRNPNDPTFLPHRTFNIVDVKVEEMDALNEFELITTDRVFELRTQTEQQTKQWLRAITLIKKEIKRKTRKKVKSPQKKKEENNEKKWQNESTLPSIGPTKAVPFLSKDDLDPLAGQTAANRFSYNSVASRNSMSIQTWRKSFNQLKEKFHEHFKKLSPQYMQHHVFIGKLVTKTKDLFMTNKVSHYYILFSSKSLYPDEHISEDNLTEAFLPHWADIDCLYRVVEQNLNAKMMFGLVELKEMTQNSDHSLSVQTQAETFEFLFESEPEQSSFKMLLDIAHDNARECKDSMGRRNYDGLILLHSSNLEGFQEKIKEMIQPLAPQNHQFEPSVIKKLTDNLNPLLDEILTAFENKVNSNQVTVRRTIIDFVRIVHEEIKRYLKLVWDSSFSKVKGIDVLNILRALSTYESLVNKYVVKDKEIYEAEKQLSKIYVRTLYRNFEKIIINIVQKQKTDNYYTVEQDGQVYAQTHAVTDIFKFIYDFFTLAIPCWNDKLHLHNIHKLVKRALGVFIGELKSMVDEVDIGVPQMIAIANNYVSFGQQIEEFYSDKFSELQERTKDFYDALKTEFRQISMVIIDRLVVPLSIQLKVFFNSQTFFGLQMERAYELIIRSELHQNMGSVHFIFKKRYYERIFTTLREEILKMLEKEVQNTKKAKDIRSKVVERVARYKTDCQEMAQLLLKHRLNTDRELSEVTILLTTQRREEIAFIMTQATDTYKRMFKRILALRDDYKSLQSIFQSIEIDSPVKGNQLKAPEIDDDTSDRKSISRLYMQEFDRSSIEHSSTQQLPTPAVFQPAEQNIKMISQGYVRRNKFNSGTYQKIFLKLKKSILYIYQNEKAERCQNTISIIDIQQIKVPAAEKANFTICFQGLHKVKEFKIRCIGIEDRMRWCKSIDSELRRLRNDKKMKVLKMKDLTCNIIIDYDELEKGRDYFSYGENRNQ